MASKTDSAVQTMLSATDFVSKTDFTVQTALSATGLTPNSKPKIHFDKHYMKTFPALLKISQAILCLTGLICVRTIYMAIYHSAGGWYYFVSMTGFWTSLFFLSCYIFHIVERFQWIPWLVAEWSFALLWAFFFFIATCVSATHGKTDPAWAAAAVLGFLAGCIYGYEAYQKYIKWQSGDVPQGEGLEVIEDSNTAANESAN